MNKQLFLDKIVINKNNEKGVVTSFDNDYLIIQYQNESKRYHLETSFKNHYLSFEDDSLNSVIKKELSDREETKIQKEKEAMLIHQKYLTKRNKVMKSYLELLNKTINLQKLFGRDFIYPPLLMFVKKYRYYVNG